MFVDINTTH